MLSKEEKVNGIYITTMIVRNLLERGECELFFEDGTKVKPEEYFWDESHFPIEIVVNGKRFEINKNELD